MNGRRARGSGRKSASLPALALVVLLPALLCGPALGGMKAWLHSHGPSGGHLHVLMEHLAPDRLGALYDWHHAQHRRWHEGGTRGEDALAPTGLMIDLPRVLVAPCRGSTFFPALSSSLPAIRPAPRWQLERVEAIDRGRQPISGWPPERPERGGVAALLCSSHALLI